MVGFNIIIHYIVQFLFVCGSINSRNVILYNFIHGLHISDESSCSQPNVSIHYISSAQEILRLPISNWYEVGIALKLDQNDLQILQKKNSDNMEICKAQMLQKWFDSNDQVCYEDLIKALASTTDSDNLVIAQELCEKQGMHTYSINYI